MNLGSPIGDIEYSGQVGIGLAPARGISEDFNHRKKQINLKLILLDIEALYCIFLACFNQFWSLVNP